MTMFQYYRMLKYPDAAGRFEDERALRLARFITHLTEIRNVERLKIWRNAAHAC
jgi:hypothetical protein